MELGVDARTRLDSTSSSTTSAKPRRCRSSGECVARRRLRGRVPGDDGVAGLDPGQGAAGDVDGVDALRRGGTRPPGGCGPRCADHEHRPSAGTSSTRSATLAERDQGAPGTWASSYSSGSRTSRTGVAGRVARARLVDVDLGHVQRWTSRFGHGQVIGSVPPAASAPWPPEEPVAMTRLSRRRWSRSSGLVDVAPGRPRRRAGPRPRSPGSGRWSRRR